MTGNGSLAELYESRVLAWARRVRNDVRISPADATITTVSRTCGSTLTLDLRSEHGRITALGYRVRACTLGAASTSVFVKKAIGSGFDEVVSVGDQLRQLLNGSDVAFPDAWQDLDMFVAARPFVSRHGSIMLPFLAVVEAKKQTQHGPGA